MTRIYYFKNLDLDKIAEDSILIKYSDLYPEELVRFDMNLFRLMNGEISRGEYEVIKETEDKEYERKIRKYKESLPRVNKDRLKCKIEFVCHAVIRRVISHPDGAMVNSSLLRSIVDVDVFYIIKSLRYKRFIDIAEESVTGKTSRKYTIPEGVEVDSKECKNHQIIGYCKKFEAYFKEEKRNNLKVAVGRYGKNFMNYYRKSLMKFKIVDEVGFKKELSEHYNLNKYYFNYLKYIFSETCKDRFFSVDNQGRLYHIISSLPTFLKPYLNIKYEIDCRNSHPFLFNHVLLNHYGVSEYQSIKLMDKIHSLYNDNPLSQSSISYHNRWEKLCNALNDYKLSKRVLREIPQDSLRYIMLTTIGKFWDYVCVRMYEDGTISRNLEKAEIKSQMFGQVFYSKSLSTRYKPYAKWFKLEFPNVFKVINTMKKSDQSKFATKYFEELGVDTSDRKSALPKAMMALEAKIITSSLTSIYNKKLCAVDIHDSVVVPDCPENDGVTEDVVRELMLKNFRKYGLVPTLSAK
jgi:hypothetical protein